MKQVLNVIFCCLIFLAATVSVQAQTQLGQDIDGEAVDDRSGWAVDISDDGTIIAIGARYNDGTSQNAGHVRIYEWNGSAWMQKGNDIDGITIGPAFAELGGSVALSSDGLRVAVASLYGGYSKVYEWSGSAWVQMGTDITVKDINSIALSDNGTRVAIANKWANRVKVYDWNGSAWTQTGTDINGDVTGDFFGTGMAISGDGSKIVVGAERANNYAGYTKIYEWNGSAWTVLGSNINGNVNNEQSGHAVDISTDGTRIITSAVYGNGSGLARVYDWNGSSWVLSGSAINGVVAGDFFGESVSISGDGQRIAVGAIFHDGNGIDAGQVKAFEWDGSAWTQVDGDIDGEAANDQTGQAVSLSADGTEVITGAIFNDGNGTDAGHARVFALSPNFSTVSLGITATCANATSWSVPIQIDTDISLGAVSFVLDYDQTALTYTGFTSATYGTMVTDGLINDDGDKLSFSWVTTGTALSYTANTTLLNLNFTPNTGGAAASPVFTWSTVAGDCEVADNNAAIVNTTFSDATGTINATPTIGLTGNAIICAGDNVTFTATGGTAYEFFVNGNSQGSASATATFSSTTLVNGDVVTVTGTDVNTCSATSSGITMTVNALPTPTLISDKINDKVCVGETITFTASGGTSYEFFVDNVSQGTASATNTFASSTLTNGQVVTVTVTDANSCEATHAGITVTVNPLPTIGLTSDATVNTICAGDNVTFTATGGTSYEFFVNANSQGSASATATFSSTTLVDGDIVTVIGTDANSCSATSTGITMTVNALPTATLTSDKTNDEICAGETITFTATGAGVTGSGNALNFINGNDEVSGTNANLPQGNTVRTIEAWVKTDAGSGGDESIFEYGLTFTGNARSGLFIRSSGRLVHIAGGNDLDGTTNIRDGQWHHVAVTHDGTTTTLYLDGNVEGSGLRTYATNGTNFTMGGNANGEQLDGTIDEVRVWNIVKTQSEISSDMGNELTGSESGLVAYYNFNQGVAGGTNTGITTLTDATGNGNGTLNNFALTGSASNFVSGATGVTNSSYQFFVGTTSQGAASATNTFSSSSLTNGQVVKVTATNANGCSADALITVTVNPLPTPTLTSSDADDEICVGESVTYTATGADEYIFQVNGSTVQAQSATATYTTTGLANNDVVSVIGVNTTTGCQAASTTTFTMSVILCYEYSGEIIYKNTAETYMGNVALTLTETGGTAYNTTTSLVDGTFSFTGLPGGTYTLAYSTGKTHGGINSTDALSVILHSVNVSPLTGLYQDAADVNADNTETATDALLIRRRFIGLDNSFAAGDWIFEDQSFILSGDLTNQKIYALAYGDVNGSFTPNATENTQPTVFFVDGNNIEINDGDNVVIPVRLSKAAMIGAVSLSINYPTQGLTINSITLPNGQNILYNTNGGELRIAWADVAGLNLANNDILFNINATVNDANIVVNTPMTLNDVSEIANDAANPYTLVDLVLPTFSTISTNTNNLTATDLGVRHFPNPFSDFVTIEYNLPTTSEVSIIVTNALGQQVQALVNATQNAGEQQVNFTANDLPAGIYNYTIKINDGDNQYQITRQLMLIK